MEQAREQPGRERPVHHRVGHVFRTSPVEACGLRVNVREAGHGRTLVLVHGLGVSGRYLLPLGHQLAERWRVIIPDLPGWGESERPRRPLGVGGAADVLAEVLRRRADPGCPIVANSFGCQVTLTLARRRPTLAGPLVLIGPTVDPRYRSLLTHAGRLGLDSLREPHALWPILIGDYLRMGPRRVLATARAALADRPERLLGTLRQPVLVLRGERDGITTLDWAQACAALVPRGSFAPVTDAPHAAHFSHPLAVYHLVEAFLAECDDRRRELVR